MDAKQMVIEGQSILLKDEAARNAIADEYDSTSTYSVGDYCIYGGIFYRCTTAVTTAESFDSTKWTATQVGDELLDIEVVDTQEIWDKLGTATLDTDADNVSDAVNELNSSLTQKINIAVLTGTINCSYADSTTIGYRPLLADRLDITTMSGYPTGKTILGVVANCNDNLILSIVGVTNNRYVVANRKEQGNVSVNIYVLYY